ncbi:aspartate ammonia-lyase [Eupransor demetentiae]|uniref:Aspartate ammonia-lyase (AspA) n=1 Tax=Eupransor demetentiae TaxID=3109584 RepID=A0ABP0EQJ5_9LACO|nr:Aspartate ammonia-lyase (AspA) [Lactobacillaceae bacterium LMG 33000]
MRTEHDSIGTHSIPDDAYYGIHTARAIENFPICGEQTSLELVRGLIEVKLAAAKTNLAAGELNPEVGQAIINAAQDLLKHDLNPKDFPTCAIQGGAGTSTNMNVNEVLANYSLEKAGHNKGDYQFIHPNDHINCGQSTNDAYPTAGKIALVRMLDELFTALSQLDKSLTAKGLEFSKTYKLGRTQLQDAVPMTLGNSFHSWQAPLRRDLKRLKETQKELEVINLGGSAIGSAINASAYYENHIVEELAAVTGLPLRQAPDLFDATVNLDGFLSLSSRLKSLAINLSKMANDLRLMSSGPRSGLNEIHLPAKQAGSSIMPGKVNPVIPEVVNQVAFEMMGFDTTISAAAEAGQFELNAFEPIIFKSLFAGIKHLTAAIETLRVNAIDGITANKKQLKEDLEHSVAYATAMVPILGYQDASDLAKEAIKSGKSLKELVTERQLFTPEQMEKIFDVETLVINQRSANHGLIFNTKIEKDPNH